MNKLTALFSLALALPAGAFQAPTATPVPSKAKDVVAQAIAANRSLAAVVKAAKSALPDTKAFMADVDRAMGQIAASQDALDKVSAGINVPRPDASGKADALMDAIQKADDAASSATPDGHSLADGYFPLLARLREYDPYGDAAVADLAMETAVANMQRAVIELRKQAYSIGYELRYRLSDTELGDRDLRAFRYDDNMAGYDNAFGSVKRDLQREENEKGAPADYVRKIKSLEDQAVFGSPRSA